jgi:hypothetical protein
VTHREKAAAKKLRAATQAAAEALRLLRPAGAPADLVGAIDEARAVLASAAAELDPEVYLTGQEG